MSKVTAGPLTSICFIVTLWIGGRHVPGVVLEAFQPHLPLPRAASDRGP